MARIDLTLTPPSIQIEVRHRADRRAAANPNHAALNAEADRLEATANAVQQYILGLASAAIFFPLAPFEKALLYTTATGSLLAIASIAESKLPRIDKWNYSATALALTCFVTNLYVVLKNRLS